MIISDQYLFPHFLNVQFLFFSNVFFSYLFLFLFFVFSGMCLVFAFVDFALTYLFYRLLSVPPLLFMYPMLLSSEFLYTVQTYLCELIVTFFISHQ